MGTDCVPLGCTGIDSNGVCAGCLDPLKEVVDGACVLKTCPEGENLLSDGSCSVTLAANQKIIDGVVYTIPEGCADLVKINVTGFVRCSGCESGYHFEQGKCVADGERRLEEVNLQAAT